MIKCTIIDHEQQNLNQICISDICQFQSRRLCTQCLKEGRHKHQSENLDHILDPKQFQEYLKKKLDTQQIHVSQIIDQLKKCIDDFIKTQTFILKFLLEEQYIQGKQLEQGIPKSEKDFYLLNNEQINSFSMFNISTKLNNVFQIFDSEFIQVLNQFQFQILQFKDNLQIYYQNTPQQEAYLKYEYILDQKENTKIQTLCAISEDGQYLAQCNDENLTISYLRSKQIVKQINRKLKATILQFTSNYLFVGCQIGQIYCLQVQKNFDDLPYTFTHDGSITQLMFYNEKYLISCSHNLIKNVQFSPKLDIWVIVQNDLQTIDIDKSKNYLLCSTGVEIKIYDIIKGRQISKLNVNVVSGIIQMKTITNNTTLLTLLQNGSLNLWHINHKQSKLIFLNKINNEIFALSFQLVLKETKILLICLNEFIICDCDCFVEKKIKHGVLKIIQYQPYQMKSLEFVLISGQEQYQIFKRIQN